MAIREVKVKFREINMKKRRRKSRRKNLWNENKGVVLIFSSD